MERSRICFLNRHSTQKNDFKLLSHDCCEIVCFLAGSGKELMDGREFPVAPGSFCVISPGTRHTEIFDGDGEILFIGFEYAGSELIPKEGAYVSDDNSVPSFMKRIMKEYTLQETDYKVSALALLDLLLVGIKRSKGSQDKKCRDLDYIKAYLEQYYSQRISFSQLAALSGYSYDYFRSVFTKRFGVSPQEYLIRVRLANARLMLENTRLSCTEIAYSCGFSNASQLSSMFKRSFGKPPSAFRISD